MGDKHQRHHNPPLLFTALRSGRSLQIFCPDLDYCENRVCLCARGAGVYAVIARDGVAGHDVVC